MGDVYLMPAAIIITIINISPCEDFLNYYFGFLCYPEIIGIHMATTQSGEILIVQADILPVGRSNYMRETLGHHTQDG